VTPHHRFLLPTCTNIYTQPHKYLFSSHKGPNILLPPARSLTSSPAGAGPRPLLPSLPIHFLSSSSSSLLAPPASLSWSSSTASHLPRRRTSRHRRLSSTCPNERQRPNLDHKRRPSSETNNLQIEIETPVVEMM
jgi:hypothetical protein